MLLIVPLSMMLTMFVLAIWGFADNWLRPRAAGKPVDWIFRDFVGALMEIILLQKVANLGNIGDRVKVKSGYGRNFLLPQGKATLATADNIAKFEARRAELEKAARRRAVGGAGARGEAARASS